MHVCHLMGGGPTTASSWTGFALPQGVWTLLVLVGEDGQTGVTPFAPPSTALPVILSDAYLWQPQNTELLALSQLDDTATVKAIGKHASPAALVITSPDASLLAAFAALKQHRALLGKIALQRRYGKPVTEIEPLPLDDLMHSGQPPSVEVLQALLTGSRGIQLWHFAGEWGLSAVLSGAVDDWAGRLSAGAPIKVHSDASSIPVW